MSSIYFTMAVVSFLCCGVFLIASTVMFFVFRIPNVVKDLRGSLEQKQIEEIRLKNDRAAGRKGSINVFEELEQKVKPRKNNTQRIKSSATTDSISLTHTHSEDEGTTVLQKSAYIVNSNFRIEKNIIFVSTTNLLK